MCGFIIAALIAMAGLGTESCQCDCIDACLRWWVRWLRWHLVIMLLQKYCYYCMWRMEGCCWINSKILLLEKKKRMSVMVIYLGNDKMYVNECNNMHMCKRRLVDGLSWFDSRRLFYSFYGCSAMQFVFYDCLYKCCDKLLLCFVFLFYFIYILYVALIHAYSAAYNDTRIC